MEGTEFQKIINGYDIWFCVIIMISIVILQSVFFMKEAIKEAARIGISEHARKAAMRSASITAIGPSLSPIIIMIAMSAMLGTPYTWFVLNNVGAARTELAVAAMGSSVAGVTVMDANIGIKAWTYGIWAGVLNSAGWLIFVFLFNHKMESMVDIMYSRYDKRWIKALLGGATLALFAYLLSSQLVGKSTANYAAAAIAGICSFVLGTALKKYNRLQEVSLGLSMLVGMFLTQFLFG
ncbi:hypothetical protein DSECCO2_299840 [anaerobic digester metagenome]